MTSTVRGARPLARAVRMKSLPSTPSMAARVIRAIGAIANSPSVTAGSTSWRAVAANVVASRASALSTRNRPVTRGGGVEKASRRPSGAGAQPSR